MWKLATALLCLSLASCTTYSAQQDAEQFYTQITNKAKRDCYKDGWTQGGEWSPACQRMMELRQQHTDEVLAHQSLSLQRGQFLLGLAGQMQGYQAPQRGVTCTEFGGITRCF